MFFYFVLMTVFSVLATDAFAPKITKLSVVKRGSLSTDSYMTIFSSADMDGDDDNDDDDDDDDDESDFRDEQNNTSSPQQLDLESLEDYCLQLGVDVQVVPKGIKIKPPKENVLNLGLNPNLIEEMNMLDYLFRISSDDDIGIHEGKDERMSDGGDGAWE
jgi:hypothetical protein